MLSISTLEISFTTFFVLSAFDLGSRTTLPHFSLAITLLCENPSASATFFNFLFPFSTAFLKNPLTLPSFSSVLVCSELVSSSEMTWSLYLSQHSLHFLTSGLQEHLKIEAFIVSSDHHSIAKKHKLCMRLCGWGEGRG